METSQPHWPLNWLGCWFRRSWLDLFGGFNFSGGAAAVSAAWVVIGGDAAGVSARVLPRMAFLVPAKAELRERRGDFLRRLFPELHPNPSADNLGDFPEVRGFVVEQPQKLLCGQEAVFPSAVGVKLRQLACRACVGVRAQLLGMGLES